LAGVNDREAAGICREAGIEYHGDDITMEDAVKLFLEKMKGSHLEETP
jgi:hypothetical protein